MWHLYKFLAQVLPFWFAAGKITVTSSDYYQFDLPFTPKQVDTEFSDPNGIGVCNGENDGFDVRLIPDGFILVVTLNSQSRTIKWMAKR